MHQAHNYMSLEQENQSYHLQKQDYAYVLLHSCARFKDVFPSS
jgi:hypothetical protein